MFYVVLLINVDNAFVLISQTLNCAADDCVYPEYLITVHHNSSP